MSKGYLWGFMLLLCGLGVFLMANRLNKLENNSMSKPPVCGITVSQGDAQNEEFEDLTALAKDRIISKSRMDTVYLKPEIQVRYIIDNVVIGIDLESEQEVIFNTKATIEFATNKGNKEDVVLYKIKTADGKFKIQCPNGNLIEYTTKELREKAKK